MYRLILVFFAAVVVGCTTTQSVPVEERSRTYDAPARAVFEAAMQTLVAQGYPIDNVDRRNGVIATGTRYQSYFPARRRLRANVYVDGIGSGQTRLTLLLTAEDVDSDGHLDPEMMRGRTARGLYQDLLDEIEIRI